MPIELVRTTYGPPALDALARVVGQAKADEPLAPVTVVVPSNHVGVTARRALAAADRHMSRRGAGVIGVTFLTPYRLAELLGAPALAAAGRRPVSNPVMAAALRRALRDSPGVFAPVSQHAATEEALVTAAAELADLSSPALDQLAATSPRAADVVRLFRRARAQLAAGWYDEADLVQSARTTLRAELDNPAGSTLGHLVIHLPQDLTRRAAALLRDVSDAGPSTVITALAGRDRPDAGVHRSLRRLGIDAPEAARSVPVGDAPGWPVSAAATNVVTTSDADEEVRAAVRAIVDATRAGTPLERVAVLFAAPQPYGRLVHEHLTAAGIPANGMAPQSLAGRALGRMLLDLLGLRRHGYRRSDVMSLLTAAPLQSERGRPAPTADWERMSREAVVVGGRSHWDYRLERLAQDIDRRRDDIATAVAEVDPDRESRRVMRLQRRVDDARALRELVLSLIDELDAAAATPRPWRDQVAWVRKLARSLVGSDQARERWPDDERKAADRVEAALDRLAALDDVDDPATLEVFHRTLELELDADLGRVGRFGEGVLVAPLSFAIGLDLDLVVVVGMAEGTLPARVADDSLLPDRERTVTGGELPLRREQIDRQHRQLVAALAGARTHLLCAPRGDLRASNERMTSRWLVEILGQIDGTDSTDGLGSADGAGDGDRAGDVEETCAAHVHSFAYAVTHLSFPATAQEYRLGAMAWAAEHDSIVVAGKDLQSARRSSRFTRYDGNLGGQPVRSPLDDIVSATRLESWAVCPHAYFMRQVLRVEPVEDPADTLWISPLDKGSLVHEILERFVQTILDRPLDQRPGPAEPWSPEDHALLREVGGALCDSYEARGIVGRNLFWQRDRERILLRLDRLLHEDDLYRRRAQSRPIAAEMAFGLPGTDDPPVDVPISEGRTLHFRGSADRVDLAEEGTLRVIDYKTGRPHDYRRLSPTNPDDHGTHLQLAVYGVAARARQQLPEAPVAAEYWFVTDRDPLTTIGYEVTDEVLERVGATLGTIVDGIEQGQFVARPTATSTDPWVRCRYCDPDGLGVTELRRAWDRKRRDPQLTAYAELAEPSVP
jgi:RecB family exonuclease